MPATDRRANPFPGLRPFEAGESHLFFGRDGQSRELVRRLGLTRFLAVVGTSGSGKSSLVRAGLLPALRGGMMDGVDGGWRVAAMRPGDNPIGNLAAALTSADALGPGDPGEAAMQAAFAEAALRRSSLGLIDVVRQERGGSSDGGPPLPEDENVLVLVDQFEEIFRFRSLIEVENSKEDAAAFVRLLLEAAGEVDERIYVVLTMRSDFLGDCSQFQGLPEAINDGQYLIPRMTRDERREAVTGPVAVGGGSITDPLVNQLLNDMGDNPDQLPILQHALMRTWDYWLGVRRDGEAIDLPHYRAVGGMSEALSLHAEEAYDELGTPGQKEGQQSPRQHIAEKLFKGLTEKGADNREIRRPVELREACEIAGADVAEVAAVVEVFRRAGRSFLMPPPDRPLTPDSLIDISHESLIRNWDRLKGWVDDEAQSARVYRRLAETAALYEKKEAGLWGDPDLQRALDWREGAKPNETWAKRYNPGYESAMSFLKLSSEKREADAAAEERRRREKERMLRGGIAGLSVLLILMLGATAYAWAQSKEARRQAEIARHQTAIAEDQTLKADSAKRDAEQLYEAALRSAESEKRQKDLAERKEAEARQQEAEAKTQKRLAEQQRAAAEKAKAAAERAKAAAEKAKAAAERAKAAAVSAQAETERRRVEAEMATVEAKRLAEVAELEREKATKANAEFQDVLSDLTKVERSAPFYHYMVRYKNVDVPVSATFTDEGDKVWTSFANNVFYLTEKTADPTLVSTPFGKTPDGVPGLKVAHLGAAGLGKFAFAFPNADKTAPVALGYAALDRNDKTVVKLWRPGDKEPTPLTHDAEVTSIAADPKGERLVTSSADGTVRLWEVGSGNSLGELRGHLTTVNSAVFSHDGSRVVTASDDETAQLWDARGGYGSVVLRGHTSGVHKAVFSPDDALVLTAGKDNTARLWDSRSGELVQVLEGHTDEVVDAAFAPDGKRLVTASLDRTAIVWQQFKGREGVAWKSVAVLRGHIDALTSVDVSADSNYVATAGVDSTTRVWNLTELNGFRVSGVELQSRKTAYSGLCPAPLKVTGKISAKGAAGGTVKYKFVRSDGAESPVRELVFDGPGKKDVSWTGDYYSKAPVSSVSVRVE
ncbi:MAG TPA: hypothetical protein VF570_02310, partial [Pyrinomonadaceae bacterium]